MTPEVKAAVDLMRELAGILRDRGHVSPIHDQQRADAIDVLLTHLDQLTEENERLLEVDVQRVDVIQHLRGQVADLKERATKAEAERDEANRRADALEALVNNPEVESFLRGVQIEAAHQVERWGADHDAGKEPQDWFWLVGYLGGKALAAAIKGDLDKAKHHTISTAAALKNWHAQLSGKPTAMRPGVDAHERGFTTISTGA